MTEPNPSPAVLLDLIERVRAAKGPDREIDKALWCWKHGYERIEVDLEPWPRYYARKPGVCNEIGGRDIAAVTGSIDAMLALVERELAPKNAGINLRGSPRAWIYREGCPQANSDHVGGPALALCEAFLSAKLALTQGADHAPK